MDGLELDKYLSNGVSKIVNGIIKGSLKNPKTGMFMARHIVDSKNAEKLRLKAENNGEHIPPFLIASITNQCNLHCKGCYARANHICTDNADQDDILKQSDWGRIFTQAEELGIEFILLAGGEPFVRKDVLSEAGKHKKILFPIFTNGTMISEEYINLLESNHNLLPVFSMEGLQSATDGRRGNGMYEKLLEVMKHLNHRGVLFGASVTVTKQNIEEVLSDEFLSVLENTGAKAVIFVEYVPVDGSKKDLAPDDDTRKILSDRLDDLRNNKSEMVLVSFPGDEKAAGGCLAAGRGFFHINANGDAEPCPFSPYSDTSLKEVPLRAALRSPLFEKLKSSGDLEEDHVGGCVLFEKRDKVVQLV